MSEPGLSPPTPPLPTPSDVARSGLHLVRLPVERPGPAVAFLHARSEGVMDLIAHFWERLAQTPPLQRNDLHLVVAGFGESIDKDINISNIDPAVLSGAMLYVPKAHRADVLALDAGTAGAFAAYICHQGGRAIRSDNAPPAASQGSENAAAGTAGASNGGNGTGVSGSSETAAANISVPLMDMTTTGKNAAAAVELPVDVSKPGSGSATAGGSNSPSANGGNGKVPIDFLTGLAEGIRWMTPLLLPAVNRKAPARELVNVVMQLTPEASCGLDPNVRVATGADVPTLNRWRRQYKEERGILFDADLDAWVQTQRIFVYEHEKQIVAVAKFDLELPRLIEIGGVYTFPEFRQQGFGAKIVSDLAYRIRQTDKIPTLQVDAENIPALRLYEGAGWRPMGRLARVWLTG